MAKSDEVRLFGGSLDEINSTKSETFFVSGDEFVSRAYPYGPSKIDQLRKIVRIELSQRGDEGLIRAMPHFVSDNGGGLDSYFSYYTGVPVRRSYNGTAHRQGMSGILFEGTFT